MIDKSPCIVICIIFGMLSIIEFYLLSKEDSTELKIHSIIGSIGFGMISLVGLYGVVIS